MGGVILASLVIGCLTSQIYSLLPATVAKIYGVTLIPYFWMFLIASLVAEKKDVVIPFLKKYWWVFVALLLLKRYVIDWDIRLSLYGLFDSLLLFTGLVGFAYAVPQVNIKVDISYGVYIYHMTVVNALIVLGFTGEDWILWVVIGVTCLLAWLSTVTIGKLSLKMKQKPFQTT